MVLVYETKFTVRKSKEVSNVLACDNIGRSLGELDTLGEIPPRDA